MTDRHVLVVEDIVDSGLSICFVKEYLQKKDPLSLKVAALMSKPERRKVEIERIILVFVSRTGLSSGTALIMRGASVSFLTYV